MQNTHELPPPDRVITLGDVLGSQCTSNCGKVVADYYQGLVLPYW